VKVAEEEKVAPWGGGRPLLPPEAVGEAATAVPWARQGGDGHYLRAVVAVQTRSACGSDRAADGGPHTVLIFFSI
jgi:hypothetical protein